jgi:hypothetical protein
MRSRKKIMKEELGRGGGRKVRLRKPGEENPYKSSAELRRILGR